MGKKVILIIRDGWGINYNPKDNAVAAAGTPNNDMFLKKYPNTVLEASGCSVGVPKGYQGSSEVGHLNMGAGRIVKQEITRINDSIEDGSFFKNDNFQKAINNCKDNNAVLHLMGLVQDEGVHAHQDHLFAIMDYAAKAGVVKLYIHFFADGRDTPPRSSLDYLRVLNEKIKELKLGQIGTLMGRYYSMDRSENWKLTSRAYETLVKAKGKKADSAAQAIQGSYDNDTTPDGTEMFDEYIPPTVIGDYPGIKDKDSVIYFNYRQDRAIQLTRAFIEDDYPGKRETKLDIVFCGLTRYYDEFKFNILDALDESKDMENLLGRVIADKGLKQLRIAETQKFRHVTSFFNGKIIEPFKNEERIKIESVYDPATFAEHPEMNAYEVKDEVIKQIKTNKFDFVAVNFANCDMVGHTGDMEAAKKAVEVVDECVGQVVEAASDIGAVVLITADHGNAEEMVDHKTGLTKTAHSTNPVEFIYISADTDGIKLRPKGILADIAPTVLYLMDIEKPIEMTAENLIVV